MVPRRVSSLWITVPALLLFPALTFAQQDASGIAGVVKDNSGAVLPGVTIEAASPALIERVRTVVSDGQGQYKIINLRPGVYSVTFSLPGFNSIRREGIELTASFTANVNAELRVGAIAETVTVTGQSPTIDVQSSVQAKVMTREIIDALPVGNKNVASIGVLIPGMNTTSQDVGGAVYGTATLSVHGSRERDQLTLLDGMYINNGRGLGGSATSIAPNDATIQEVSIGIGGATAEVQMGGVQANLIPKDGGNRFTGLFIGAYTNHSLQGHNTDSALIGSGLSGDTIKSIWDIDPAFGGPLIKDRLWFYGSVRVWQTEYTIGGLYFNKSTVPYIYTPDLSRPAVERDRDFNESLRLTWQVSPRNKVAIHHQNAGYDRNGFYSTAASRLNTPDAITSQIARPSAYALATWTSTVSSRFLIVAGSAFGTKDPQNHLQPGMSPATPSYKELSTNLVWGNNGGVYGSGAGHAWIQKISASYVTGSNAAKVGLDLQHAMAHAQNNVTGNATTLQLLNGAPRQVTVYAEPVDLKEISKYNLGLFAQDQWTIKNLTLNLGIRYDHVKSYVPASHAGPTYWTPTRNVDFARVDDVPNWEDISPRLGAAYDLFGNGKTAVKVSLGQYLEGYDLITYTRSANPLNAVAISATRTWTDTNRDFLPQLDELGPVSNANFGNSVINTRFAEDVPTTRGHNWEFSLSLQHELMPKVSANVAYFRRQYGNTTLTQNTAVTAADFSPYCVTVPVDPRLPGGGGNQLCGFYDVSQALFGRTANVVQEASHFGQPEDVYDGVDLNMNARLPRGVAISGGANFGRERYNNCYATSDPSLSFADSRAVIAQQGASNTATAPRTSDFCDIRPPFQPNVKFLVVYPLPWWGLQTSGTYQGLPGPQITATRVYTNAEIAPSLGRPLSSGTAGNVTLDLIPAGTMYGGRLNQVNVRVGKTFRFGGSRRIQANVDLYNMLNANPVIANNLTYGSAWLRPTQILQARLLKFSTQIEF